MRRVLDKEKFVEPDVSWADGSWFDSTKKWPNAQNSGLFGQGGPEKRGAPGVVFDATAPALRNGVALMPQIAPYNAATDARYFVANIPANDVSSKIRTTVPGSGGQDGVERWTLSRGPAPRRAAARTTEQPTRKSVRRLP